MADRPTYIQTFVKYINFLFLSRRHSPNASADSFSAIISRANVFLQSSVVLFLMAQLSNAIE